MQLGTDESLEQFEKFEKDLEHYARHNWEEVASVADLEMGTVVLVDGGKKSTPRWRRGQVVGIMQDSAVDIFYIDYGNSELAQVSMLCSGLTDAFTAYPPQAVRCSLAGVKPLVKSWTSRGIRTFQQLTADHQLHVLFLYGKPGCYDVALYQSTDGSSVAHALIAEDVAVEVDGQSIPESVSDIPAFMAQVYQSSSSGSPADKSAEYDTNKPISASPSAQKYIPPHQKVHGSSPGSAGSRLANQNHSPQSTVSAPKSSQAGTQASTGLSPGAKGGEPVNDFFPFETVSVYSPSPRSPVKPNHSGDYGNHYNSVQNGSYFSKPGSRYGQNNGHSPAQNNGYRSYQNDPHFQHSKLPEKSRFAANFDNLPAPANTFEPDFMKNVNKSPPASRSQPDFGSQKSPNQSFSDSDSTNSPRPRPKLNIPSAGLNPTPFYPPPPAPPLGSDRNGYAAPVNWSLSSQQACVSPPQHLVSSGVYQTNIPPPTLKPPTSIYQISGARMVPQTSSPISVPHHGSYNERNNYPPYYNDKNLHRYPSSADTYNRQEYGQRYESSGSQRSPKNSSWMSKSPGSSFSNQSNQNNNNITSPRILNQSQLTPTKHYSTDQFKMSPESPDSPGIAAFNLRDLEHTRNTSTDHFHKQIHEQKLQALQEEAEEIHKESQEQAELVNISRYGSAHTQSAEVEDYPVASEIGHIYDQIAQENCSRRFYKDQDDMKKPVPKKDSAEREKGRPLKLEGIPQSYISDINFTDAVKEALEFGKVNGMENARLLLDGVIESLKSANVEKQLYDVLMMMLSKAIKEYNLYHVIVMDTVNTLNSEMDIKSCLSKSLKRQQELCVRVPAPKEPFHLDCARVMAHVYNMSLEWSDSNASIQDGILGTVEKWILFNNKGTQIGQIDKENIFLDCFGAFWEVSGVNLIQHNQTFRSRIREEVRKKILNENVSRSIRERLLDIMLELFSLSVEKEDRSTQTQHRTMIPSSCQVKPSTCDKGTYMKLEILENDVYGNIDPETLTMNQWYAKARHTPSPDSAADLRFMGRGQAFLSHKSSYTPQDSFYTARMEAVDAGEEMSVSQNVSDVTESFYETPRESFLSESEKGTPRLNDLFQQEKENIKSTEASGIKLSDLFNKEQAAANKLEKVAPKVSEPFKNTQTVGSSQSMGVHNVALSSMKINENQIEKEFSSLKTPELNQSRLDGSSSNVDDNRTVTVTVEEKRGPSGKSIVDWFDYEPSESDLVRTGAKLEEKRIETRKKLDSTSMEILDEALKSEHGAKKKAKKEKEKEKKAAKSNSSFESDKTKVEPNKDSDVRVTQLSSLEKSIDLESQPKNNQGSENNESNQTEGKDILNMADRDVDWWGTEEAAETGDFIPADHEKFEDNIYIDNGPDVIIEDEFEQTDVETGPRNDLSEKLTTVVVGKENVSETSPVSNKKFLDLYKPEEDFDDPVSSGQRIEENDMMRKHTRDDFSFDVDENGDYGEWESDSSSDLNVNDWVGLHGGTAVLTAVATTTNYDVDFPSTDLRTVLPGAESLNENVTDNTAEDSNYHRNSPQSNLAEFIRQPEEQVVTERRRWVPGQRVCFNCGSADHTTENCKDGFVIFQ